MKKGKSQILSFAWMIFNPRFSNLATEQTKKTKINYYHNAKQHNILKG